jgi:hypothetical protein
MSTPFSSAGVVYDGMFVHVVPAGTVINDPKRRADPITVDDRTTACVGRKLYCTASTKAKLIAKIEAMRDAGAAQ